jgi:preprotein translocase subunit SecG
MDSGEEQPLPKKRIFIKIGLIFLIIVIVIFNKINSGELSWEDFTKYNYSFSLKRLNEIKGYILFFVIMITLCYFTSKANNEWARKELEKFEERERQKEKEKEEKRQEEFERKMRGIHFKED